MKLATSAVLGAAAILSAACSHETIDVAETSGLGLHFREDAGMVTLAYGVENSDMVGLMLQCAAGSRQVQVSDIARSERAPSLTLVSGGARTELPATVESAMGQPTLWATAAVDAPALRRFRDTGKIGVSTRGGAYSLTASPGEREDVRRFFRACSRV